MGERKRGRDGERKREREKRKSCCCHEQTKCNLYHFQTSCRNLVSYGAPCFPSPLPFPPFFPPLFLFFHATFRQHRMEKEESRCPQSLWCGRRGK